ncbi:MAG: YciI family protein [Proteobacteria bacterium]|nr:YciI family protein [Pseudomonadota bacterium]
MWYAIISEDREGSLKDRLAARAGHVARLEALRDEGRLLVAGPHPAVDSPDPGPAGFTGSLVIVDFDSVDEAKAWADLDPYIAAGVYRNVTVKPFNRILP